MYGPAITEAQEVLQRDNTDLTAQSILAVSGLRVSADALDQLRKVDEVKGSTRSEAESVAKTLCRKYSNLPAEEMFDKFAATVSREEFKGAVVALLKDYEKTYGRNAQQKIRVRKARPELQERAKKARLGRKR